MKPMVLTCVLSLLVTLALGQEPQKQPPPDRDRRDDQALTAEQKAQVKTILSKYSAESLTAKDAKAINEAFRAAGLRGGPALVDAMRDAGFVPEKISQLDPPPDRQDNNQQRPDDQKPEPSADGDKPKDDHKGKGGGYSIEQAISDRAQMNTIAFDGLAFLTGQMACNTFLPPGKVADFCGFQYMRDVDTNQLGHNTSFVPRAANNMLYALTDQQKAQLIALAKEQEKLLTDFAYKRFPLIKAFYRQLTGDVPSGTELSREAVMKFAAELYEIDGKLCYRRAEVLGGIVRSFTDKQKEYLAKMKFNDSSTWPELKDQVDKRSMSHTAHVAVMTYASEMFSWYAGSVDGDVYFCPERHATYFGSFYMKDIPAMGNPNYSISTSLTGDSGEAFLAALTETQRKLVTGLVDQQRDDMKEVVKTRREIATLLRQFMKQEKVDRDKVMALSRRYGELDGEISYFYAKAFAQVAKTLTDDQKKTLLKLRNLDPKFTPKGAYLYSAPIDMPTIPNTDFLFAKPQAEEKPATSSPAANGTSGSFKLTSPDVAADGLLPKEFTGDGAAATLPLEWKGAPKETKSFALIMHHVAPDKTKWYWILYDIPADTTSLPKNVRNVGVLGNNSVNGRQEYAPPHSKGPGAKTYILTLYALSVPAKPDVEPAQVTRDVLLAAMKDKVLATAELKVTYSRDVKGDQADKP